jgi:transcriptional regulator with GAF, ATPase, and Fis domain
VLFTHRWPLNVRELRLALLTAADLAAPELGGPAVVAPEHLPAALPGLPPPNEALQSQPRQAQSPAPGAPPAPQRPLTEAEKALRDQLVESLRRCNGNTAASARELGRARTQVQRWIARFGIDLEALRRGEG